MNLKAATDQLAIYDRAFYAEQIAGSASSAAVMVPRILNLFPQTNSVVDVGCGVGAWLNHFRLHGVTRLLGLDGGGLEEGMLQITKSDFLRRDLSLPLDIDERFDLAISLEVAEHLPPECGFQFVLNLTKLSDAIVFSAAIPGQGGTAHVNEQWLTYWETLFRKQGYLCFDCLRSSIWNDDQVEWWYAQNTVVFVRESRGDLTSALQGRAERPLDIVHPRCFETYRNLMRSQSERLATLETAQRDLQDALTSSSRTIAALNERAARLNAEVEEISSRFATVIGSSSWVLTGPLRVVGRRMPALARAWRRAFPAVRRVMYAALGQQPPQVAVARRAQLQHDAAPTVNSADSPASSPSVLSRFATPHDRRALGTVFVAADMPPMYDKHAGSLRLRNLVQLLGEMDLKVVLGSLASREEFIHLAGSVEQRNRYEQELRRIGVRRIAYGSDEIEDALRQTGLSLKAALLSMPAVAEQLIPRVRMHAPWVTILYDMVDFHALRMSREAQMKSDGSLQVKADQMREIELTNARTADVTVAISDSERAALLDLDPALVVEVVPLVFELPRIAAGPAKERRGLFFVGGFWHTPNADAVIWFVKEIWPLILRQRADLVFRIAGSNAPADVLALAQRPGVEVVGFVPDLTELFDRSRVFVAPMRFGAGVKGKVGESMAHGLPVVATSIGAEGMSVRDGEHLLVADAPGAFADAVLRLVGDDELWARLQANGRKFVEQTQSMAAARLKLAELLDG